MNGTLRKLAFVPILLVLGVGGGLVMRGYTGSQASESGETKAADASTANPTGATEILPTTAAVTGLNPQSGDERRQLLETIGTLTAAHCYQTYLNIGFLADGKVKGTYTDNEAYRFLDLVFSLLDSVNGKLAVLEKIELGTEDRASLQQMRDLSNLLSRQANQLETFWHSGKKEDAAKYEEIRQNSWAAIRRITGGADREKVGN
jgi:hypothetical protein